MFLNVGFNVVLYECKKSKWSYELKYIVDIGMVMWMRNVLNL